MINSKVIIEYFDQNDGFAQFLPRTGRVIKKCSIKGGAPNWYLIRLDEQFEYQLTDHNKLPVHFFKCNYFLIRSRMDNYEIGDKKRIGVFVMLAYHETDFDQEPIDMEKLFHAAWGLCSITK
jgi:hypothetical protein